MNILLTGDKGWIGSKIADALDDNGENSLFLFDKCCRFDEWRDLFEQRIGVNIDYLDTIIHCGAISDSHAEGNLLWDMNYLATAYLAHSAQCFGIKFIYFSSCAAMKPDTQYGWTKRCAEDFIVSNINHGNYCVLQPFNVWGFDEQEKQSPSVIHKILTKTLENAYLGYERDFINVDDVVNVIMELLDNWQSGIFELGTGKGTDVVDLIYKLGNDLGNCYEFPEMVKCPVRQRRVAERNHFNVSTFESYYPKVMEKLCKGNS